MTNYIRSPLGGIHEDLRPDYVAKLNGMTVKCKSPVIVYCHKCEKIIDTAFNDDARRGLLLWNKMSKHILHKVTVHSYHDWTRTWKEIA